MIHHMPRTEREDSDSSIICIDREEKENGVTNYEGYIPAFWHYSLVVGRRR